jgi:hypothetical protein
MLTSGKMRFWREPLRTFEEVREENPPAHEWTGGMVL